MVRLDRLPLSARLIFNASAVPGLRQYWESPWATYSRGRSRWRNQFLVDYLKDAGIERSKKQVASHIQVLRNMWKGEKGMCFRASDSPRGPGDTFVIVFFFLSSSVRGSIHPEYQLVAGGEELFQEDGLLAHKSSALRATPADVRVKEESREVHSPFGPNTPSDCSDFPSESEGTLHSLDVPSERTPGAYLAPLPIAHASHRTAPVKDEGFDLHLPFPPPSMPSLSSVMGPSVSPPLVARNGITALSLGAAGMRSLLVEVDRYAPPSSASLPNCPPCVSIHIKLSLSSLHDLSSPPALHGFSGTVTFAAPWGSVAQCVTRVFAGGVCESVENAYFEPTTPLSPISMTPVTLPLPESELSRCRWGNIGA
jgi:hypothetical protein